MPNKKPLDENHIHEGHRIRLLNTMVDAGIDNMGEVQAMEFILFYVFPRGDVNPLAHRLLNEFGSVANVLDADINSLKEVKGMGDRSAKALKMLGELFFYYTQNRLAGKIHLSTYLEITDYFDELLRFQTTENFIILAIDSSFMLRYKKILATGSVKNVGISPISVANFISTSKPAYILFAHNHPGGAAKASSQDIEANKGLQSLIEHLGVKFIDHIIVGEDGVFSIKENNYLRKFVDKE